MSCDNCGNPVYDRDEILCENCKPKPKRTGYVIAFPKVISRPQIGDGAGFMGMVEIVGDAPIIKWQPKPELGTFERNVDAKRALLEYMQEIQPNSGLSDDYIRAMFRYFTNTQTAKIVKVKG